MKAVSLENVFILLCTAYDVLLLMMSKHGMKPLTTPLESVIE